MLKVMLHNGRIQSGKKIAGLNALVEESWKVVR